MKITDLRFADIDGAPKRCTLLKIFTDTGLIGFGEVRDASSRTYAAMLKSRILGEDPRNVEKLFRRVKQFGGPSRQGGGVSGIEVALWDLAGKAWGVPVWQLLGGKWRDRVRVYCDTDSQGGGRDMGRALLARVRQGFTFLKMDLGIELIRDVPGALSAPAGYLDLTRQYSCAFKTPSGSLPPSAMRGAAYDLFTTAHPFSPIHLTEKGLDALEAYLRDARGTVGYDIPLAIDHIGHIPLEDCVRLARRLEKYNLAWMEDPLPWPMTGQYLRLAQAVPGVPLATGEDIYLKEGFLPLLDARAVSVVHPDVLTAGGILELKKIGDLAEERGVAMAIHMAESPVACMAAVHAAAATRNFTALEVHSVDVPWWPDIATGLPKPLIKDGFIAVPDTPGLGIEGLNEALIKEKAHPAFPAPWAPTGQWDAEWSNDRIWS
jgi:L-alanine-DL-glutamate epimerase-like enolase superfamily enzyme